MPGFFKSSSAAAIVLALSSPVSAQAIEVTGDTSTGPTWQRPGSSQALRYSTHLISITNALAYAIYVPMVRELGGLSDPYLYLYSGSFDPLQPLLNLIASDDDSGSDWREGSDIFDALLTADPDNPLPEGHYTLVTTGYCCDQQGTYILYLDGVALGWGLSTIEQLKELKDRVAQGGRHTLRAMAGNIASALAEGEASRRFTLSTKGTSQEMFLWLRVTDTHASGDGRSLTMPHLQFGADWALQDNLVLGISVAGGKISASNSEISASGQQLLVQPYLGWNSGKTRASVSLAFGSVTYDRIASSGGIASAEGRILAGTLDVARDFAISDAANLSPFLAFRTGRMELTEASGSLAATGAGSDVTFSETRLGAVYARGLGAGRASLSLSADYFDTSAVADLASGTFGQTGWSGTVGIGYETSLADGRVVSGALEFGGIGTETLAQKAQVTFNWVF